MTPGLMFTLRFRPVLAAVMCAAALSAAAGCRCCAPASAQAWKPLPPLPEPLGVARPFAGVNGGVFLLAGGSNFPGRTAAEGGAKVCYDAVFVLADGRWRGAGKLPHGPVAEGIPVTTPDGIACLGGLDGKNDIATAFLMGWDPGAGHAFFTPLPAMPKTMRMGAGACLGRQVYAACGKQDGKVANGVWRLDLEHPEKGWQLLPPLPGVPREQPVAAIIPGADNHPMLCVFGGNGIGSDGRQEALVDGYRYDLTQGDAGVWKPAAEVRPAGYAKPVSLLGASSVVLGERMICAGGFGKEVWDRACREQAALTGDALAAYRKTYLSQPPGAFHWNSRLLAYDASADAWSDLGELPFGGRCGAAMTIFPDGALVIASGEIKPGLRTPSCFRKEPEPHRGAGK